MTELQLQVGVKALLRNPEGKYLLVRRSPKAYPEVGAKWDIVGGRINPGSPLLENLRREIKEEVNLTLNKDPTLVAAQDILRVPGRHVVRLTYVGEITGTPQVNEESEECQWFTAGQMKQLDALDIYVKELISRGVILNGGE
ncbi:MAG: NUDIX hydrolase [Candidatus Aenigmarchaeota archaeon]|nr:NUDIX hydrolase [Candidatus Aenigmarchaeota archaeon]